MTWISLTRSGGPPAPSTAAMSRKYWAPMSGDKTTRARAGSENGLLKPWTAPFGVKADSPAFRSRTSAGLNHDFEGHDLS